VCGDLVSRHHRFIGVRPRLGYWFDDEHDFGLEVSAFFLERDSSNFSVKPTPTFFARPYVNAVDHSPGAEIVSGTLPDGAVRRGGINVYGRNELFSQEISAMREWRHGQAIRWQILAGARFAQLRNRLDITATGYDEPELAVLYGVTDHFQTFNKFHGGQVGLWAEYQAGCWFVNLAGSIALGGNDQLVRTKAQRMVQTPTSQDIQPLGLYILPTNSGAFGRTVLDGIAEFRATIGWQPRECLRIQFGYTIFEWLNTIKSGDQIQPINTNQILGTPYQGPAQPTIPFKEATYWAQGVSVGLELSW
jgi:hypothetical protein